MHLREKKYVKHAHLLITRVSFAAVLLHLVSSILTYCKHDEDVKRKVFFVATHRDCYDVS